MRLFSSEHTTSHSIRSLIQSKESIGVPSISLDDFFGGCKQKSIDIIKMDIEGGEVLALQRMNRIIKAICVAYDVASVMAYIKKYNRLCKLLCQLQYYFLMTGKSELPCILLKLFVNHG